MQVKELAFSGRICRLNCNIIRDVSMVLKQRHEHHVKINRCSLSETSKDSGNYRSTTCGNISSTNHSPKMAYLSPHGVPTKERMVLEHSNPQVCLLSFERVKVCSPFTYLQIILDKLLPCVITAKPNVNALQYSRRTLCVIKMEWA